MFCRSLARIKMFWQHKQDLHNIRYVVLKLWLTGACTICIYNNAIYRCSMKFKFCFWAGLLKDIWRPQPLQHYLDCKSLSRYVSQENVITEICRLIGLDIGILFNCGLTYFYTLMCASKTCQIKIICNRLQASSRNISRLLKETRCPWYNQAHWEQAGEIKTPNSKGANY